jgi:predicted TIM-barrel fold metal-dependent hydrolase
MRPALLLALAACAPVQYHGPIIDTHAHFVTPDQLASFGPNVKPGPEALIALADAAGVQHTALIVMAKKGDLAATRALNDGAKAAADASGGKLFPVGSVHPDDGDDALAELERLKKLGFRIIKLHPNSQRFDAGSPAVAAVVAKTAELGLVVLFDAFSPFDANETGKYLMLAVTNPKAKLVLAHLGGPKFDEFAQFGMLEQYHFPWWPRNVWVDLSATAHFFVGSPYQEQLVWVIRKVGTDRALFGSDYPVDTPAHALEDVRRLGFTAEEQQRVLYQNAADLLGYGP